MGKVEAMEIRQTLEQLMEDHTMNGMEDQDMLAMVRLIKTWAEVQEDLLLDEIIELTDEENASKVVMEATQIHADLGQYMVGGVE